MSPSFAGDTLLIDPLRCDPNSLGRRRRSVKRRPDPGSLCDFWDARRCTQDGRGIAVPTLQVLFHRSLRKARGHVMWPRLLPQVRLKVVHSKVKLTLAFVQLHCTSAGDDDVLLRLSAAILNTFAHGNGLLAPATLCGAVLVHAQNCTRPIYGADTGAFHNGGLGSLSFVLFLS